MGQLLQGSGSGGGPALQQEAAATNPTIATGYASKYPLQVASRLALGLAVSRFFTPQVGIPTTLVALYGNAFQAADQNIEGLVIGLTIGEVCNQDFDGQP